jgi:hypothetical protein
MVSEEMGDGDGEVETVPLPAPTPPPTPPPQPEPAPALAAAASPELAALVQALVSGITQANSANITAARNPIHETYLNGGYPGKSVYAHPDGDGVQARTKLRCPMYLGVVDDEGHTTPAFEIFEDVTTEDERRSLNALTPGTYPGIRRNDGIRAMWRVVERRDDNGQPTRLVIAVPQTWLNQDQQAQMPSQPDFLAQLLAQHTAAVT